MDSCGPTFFVPRKGGKTKRPFIHTFLWLTAVLLLAACSPAAGPPTVDPGRVVLATEAPPAQTATEIAATPTLSYVPATHRPQPTPLPPEEQPTFINHPAPQLGEIDFAPFAAAGCRQDRSYWLCEPGNPLYELGCMYVTSVQPNVTHLEPALPLAWCFVPVRDMPPFIEALWQDGGMITAWEGIDPLYYRYVTYRDGVFEVLRSAAEVQAVYAPIESADEARSYALAVTDFRPIYGLEYSAYLVYDVAMLEDTHVTAVADGYEVLLYHQRDAGCGPFPVSAVSIHVAVDGTLTEGAWTTVYRNPEDDNVCSD